MVISAPVILQRNKVENYKDYFEKIKLFKIEQDKQKQRGLNNYNILTSVLSKSDEVRLHSRMIFSFLNPNGTHYQSNLFLDKFLDIININNFTINTKNCSVYKEYQNIDLYITDGDKHIIIENKVYAKDQENQIKRYIEIIQEENHDSSIEDILVIYLSIDKKEPSTYSLGDLKIKNNFIQKESENITLFKSIHYKNEILKWLIASQHEVQNITNLNEVFNQYIDVVKMINNQYKDKVMSLSNYIKDNETIYKLAIEIQKSLPEARQKIVNDFFENVIIDLENELGKDWIVEIVNDLSTKEGFPFRLYKKEWIGGEKKNLIFGFEFDNNQFYEGSFGIVRQSNKIDVKNILKEFKDDIKNLNYKLKTTSWWLHWTWLPNIDGMDDFAEYVMFNKNSKEEFTHEIINLINIFERKSNLMTNINAYINKTT